MTTNLPPYIGSVSAPPPFDLPLVAFPQNEPRPAVPNRNSYRGKIKSFKLPKIGGEPINEPPLGSQFFGNNANQTSGSPFSQFFGGNANQNAKKSADNAPFSLENMMKLLTIFQNSTNKNTAQAKPEIPPFMSLLENFGNISPKQKLMLSLLPMLLAKKPEPKPAPKTEQKRTISLENYA
ncbi:MAG: hypothetical protein LBM01_02430 [Christensenellaceae bacterium]|jgi:hypothetical protein|nr:hypothetical protein [Christensenellaceae bacterium]